MAGQVFLLAKVGSPLGKCISFLSQNGDAKRSLGTESTLVQEQQKRTDMDNAQPVYIVFDKLFAISCHRSRLRRSVARFGSLSTREGSPKQQQQQKQNPEQVPTSEHKRPAQGWR
jgi:hypothetical protein